MDLTQSGRRWRPLWASGTSQGSVLGPELFIIYINDVDVGLNKRISKFADDRQSPQEDLHKISAGSDRLEIPFNIDKCQGLQVGTRNKKFDYEMRDA